MDPFDYPYEPDDEEDDFPLFSEDLVRRMDALAQHPAWPSTAQGFGALTHEKVAELAYVAGYRACVDTMMELARGQYKSDAAPEPSVQHAGRVLGEGRDVRTITLGTGGLDPVSLRELVDTGDREE